MPFSFSVPLDWSGYARMEPGARDQAYPEAICYQAAARKHAFLIGRMFSQMQSGEQPDAFVRSGGEQSFVAEHYTPEGYDLNASTYIKKLSPPYVQAYYPALFALAREFEGCMIAVSNQGCNGNAECKILGFQFMGFLPDGSQYAVFQNVPDFPVVAQQDADPPHDEDQLELGQNQDTECRRPNAFVDCGADVPGSAFEDDAETCRRLPGFVPRLAEPCSSGGPLCPRYVAEVGVGQVQTGFAIRECPDHARDLKVHRPTNERWASRSSCSRGG